MVARPRRSGVAAVVVAALTALSAPATAAPPEEESHPEAEAGGPEAALMVAKSTRQTVRVTTTGVVDSACGGFSTVQSFVVD